MSGATPSTSLKDDIQFLLDLQQELNTQDNDCQANPRFWVIGDYEMIRCQEGEQDEYRVVDYDSGNEYELEEYLEDIDVDDLTEEARAAFEELTDDLEDRDDWFNKYCADDCLELVPLKRMFVIKQNTMFLTKAEAQKHLELNHYHYSKEAHTYAMTAWRAPKVARLLDILQKCDWGRVAELLGEGGQ